ncbi:MAG TPA: SDR family oxidoreductase [Vicinamibacterales bacterium]|nr:SDR family oxidoreductase [Vicinamibacterales bacterium]HOQ59047.1 SDR family oxidoreductase [Vicinamibacterales bacterium]HPK70317.1 SDR family oxidoreductase [Vicinamibacterales bacterium]
MIVVTGATGKLGTLVLEGLLGKVPASELAAVVRSPAKAAGLAARGVQIRQADYGDPEALASAFRPGEKVLLISSNEIGQRAVQHAAVLDAARRAGVGLLVYTSLLRADTSPMLLAGEHKTTEEAISASGLPYIILRNGWYIENYTDQLPAILARGTIAGAAGRARYAAATRRDYADAAVAVLTSAWSTNATYELAGDRAFTLEELAAEVSRQSGKTVNYVDLPPDEYKKVLLGAGLPEPIAVFFVDFDIAAAKGALDIDRGDLRQLIKRPTTPLSEAVAEALGRLQQG